MSQPGLIKEEQDFIYHRKLTVTTRKKMEELVVEMLAVVVKGVVLRDISTSETKYAQHIFIWLSDFCMISELGHDKVSVRKMFSALILGHFLIMAEYATP